MRIITTCLGEGFYGNSTTSAVVAIAIAAIVATAAVVRPMNIVGNGKPRALPLVDFMPSAVVIFPAMVVAVIVISAFVEVAPLLVIAAVVVAVLMVISTAYVRGRKCGVCSEGEGRGDGRNSPFRIIGNNT